jgi:hypothetical protein
VPPGSPLPEFLDWPDALAIIGIQPIRSDLIPWVATMALERGLDGPLLRRLAGVAPWDQQAETSDLIRAFEEAGLPWPARQDIPDILLRAASRAIVADRVDPIVAAHWLWRLNAELPSHHHGFDPFIYAASEADERPKERDLFVEMVKGAATDIVGR